MSLVEALAPSSAALSTVHRRHHASTYSLPSPHTLSNAATQKHYCDYCDVFLTHDSASGMSIYYDGYAHYADTLPQSAKPITVVGITWLTSGITMHVR